MKKKSTSSAQLGLTQMEMAMLLNVKSSQYSMYESNLRDLPAPSNCVLLKVHVGLLHQKPKDAEIEPAKENQQRTQMRLEDWKWENENEIRLVGKKIIPHKKKKEISEKVRPLAQFLNAEKGLVSDGILAMVNSKCKWDGFELTKLEARLEALKFERSKIELLMESLKI